MHSWLSGARLAAHLFPQARRIGQDRGDDIPWRYVHIADTHLLCRVQPEKMKRFEDLDELCAEPVLERHPSHIDPARDEDDFLVLYVDGLYVANAFREGEDLGFRKRLCRVPAALALVDEGRVQTFLDSRPNREGRGERMTLHLQVGAVAHANLIYGREEVVRRMTREDIG
jgi:hypothetical protein